MKTIYITAAGYLLGEPIKINGRFYLPVLNGMCEQCERPAISSPCGACRKLNAKSEEDTGNAGCDGCGTNDRAEGSKYCEGCEQ